MAMPKSDSRRNLKETPNDSERFSENLPAVTLRSSLFILVFETVASSKKFNFTILNQFICSGDIGPPIGV